MVEGLYAGPAPREQATPQCLSVGVLDRISSPRIRPPRKYARRFDRRTLGELPTIDLPDEGRRLYHAQLCYKPFQSLHRVVFVLDATSIPQRPNQSRPSPPA